MHNDRPTSWTDRELLGFDLETTATDPQAARPVSFAFVLAAADRVISARRELVDPGIEIPKTASTVHGITNRIIIEHGGWTLEAAVAEQNYSAWLVQQGRGPLDASRFAWPLAPRGT